jgi:hypothetical protein
MPCPFPGMDPYLENPDLWQGFHNRFLTYLCDAIQPQLPANYVALLEVRIFLEYQGNDDRENRIPDLDVIRTGSSASWAGRAQVLSKVEMRGELVDVETDALEYREAYVVVRAVSSGELITTVELLSPTNKREGEGRDQYRAKQHQLFVNGTRIVEIDLLRGGAHTVLTSAAQLAEMPPFNYLASVYRPSDTRRCQVIRWGLRDPLPPIPIPLGPEDAEIEIDLQAVFSETYDRGAFQRVLPYRGDPEPPLAPEDREWADRLLREAGLRGDASA